MVGILLINVGTPDSPETQDVERYLQEFLTDKEVIRGPWFLRHILFRHFIIPRRAPQSAHKYATIWTAEGSPLRIISEKIRTKLQKILGDNNVVELGMRYGNPSIETAVQRLQQQKVKSIVVVPLFPQYADATTKTSLGKALEVIQKVSPQTPVTVLPEFFDQPGYTDMLARNIYRHRKGEYLLFSFHGLPVSHLRGVKGCYKSSDCCEHFRAQNSRCYRAQCIATAMSVAEKLQLVNGSWSISFQSRLGPVKWIEPYTDRVLAELPTNQGVGAIDVCAPAFVADGLETLEEICREGAETFHKNGGGDFNYIPCLNDEDEWIEWLARFVTASQ